MGVTPAALGALLKGDLDNFIVASTPGGIEAQEARGQQSFVASETLPKAMAHGCTREKLESLGIVFGKEYDDIFIHCTLPNGWKKAPTDHSMWSKLLDDKGRNRAGIFYKAAFYDRSAYISLTKRFSYRVISVNGDDSKTWNVDDQHCVIFDCDRVIWESKPIPPRTEENVEKWRRWDKEICNSAVNWLKEHYPNWEDPLAYWD